MRHEACDHNEKFIGNTNRPEGWLEEMRKAGVTSARLGAVALDIDGAPLPADSFRPCFISRSQGDIYGRHMMEKFNAIAEGRSRG